MLQVPDGKSMQEDETTTRMCSEYQQKLLDIRRAFEAGASGRATIAARSAAMDELVTGLWSAVIQQRARDWRGRGGAGGGWVWAAGAVSLLGCGRAVSAGWKAGRERCEGCGPARQPGAVGLRDTRGADDATGGRV